MKQLAMSFLLLTAMASFGASRPQQRTAPDYKILLVVPKPDEGVPRSLEYFVSVPEFLDRSRIEALICKFIDQEKPQVGAIGLSIYQGLDRITIGDLMVGVVPSGHDIAIYAWPSTKRGFLTVFRDPQGLRVQPLQRYEFDHEKACPKR